MQQALPIGASLVLSTRMLIHTREGGKILVDTIASTSLCWKDTHKMIHYLE